MQAGLSHVAPGAVRRDGTTTRLPGRAAFGFLVTYAVVLGVVLLASAPVDMRVRLPLYGGDHIAFGHLGAAVIGMGALVAAVGAWLVSLGAIKNGALWILVGCAAPQFVTSSPVSLLVSVPTLIFAIVAASMARTRRIAVASMRPGVRVA